MTNLVRLGYRCECNEITCNRHIPDVAWELLRVKGDSYGRRSEWSIVHIDCPSLNTADILEGNEYAVLVRD